MKNEMEENVINNDEKEFGNETEIKQQIVDISQYSVRTPGGYLDREERNTKDDLITLKV